MKRHSTILLILFAALLASPALAAPQTGDLIAGGWDLDVSPSGAILCVDPTTGDIEIISSGGFLETINGVVVASSGDIYAICNGPPSGFVGIVMVNPKTGEQTAISEGGLITGPFGIAIGPGGVLFVTDSANAVIQVDPSSGAQTMIASGDLLQSPDGIVVEADGSIVVTSAHANDAGRSGLVRIDPASGTQSLLHASPSDNPGVYTYIGLELAESGDIYACGKRSYPNIAVIVLIDQGTGALTDIVGGDYWFRDMALTALGNLYVTGHTRVFNGYINFINPRTGYQVTVAETNNQGLLGSVRGIDIYPDTSVQTTPTTWGEIKASRR